MGLQHRLGKQTRNDPIEAKEAQHESQGGSRQYPE